MELDDLNDAILDLDALNDETLDPMYEATRAVSSIDEAARLPDPLHAYSSMMRPAVSSMLASVSKSMMPDMSALMPSFTSMIATNHGDVMKKLAGTYSMSIDGTIPKHLGGVVSIPKASEWRSAIGATVTAPLVDAVLPAVSVQNYMTMAGMDVKSLGLSGIMSGALNPWGDRMDERFDGLDSVLGSPALRVHARPVVHEPLALLDDLDDVDELEELAADDRLDLLIDKVDVLVDVIREQNAIMRDGSRSETRRFRWLLGAAGLSVAVPAAEAAIGHL